MKQAWTARCDNLATRTTRPHSPGESPTRGDDPPLSVGVRGEGGALACHSVQARGPSLRTEQRGARRSHYFALRSILVACTLALSACALFGLREPLSVTIADLQPIEIGVLEQRYAMKVRLLNPNDAEIAFDGVVFDLEINGVPFAKGVTDEASVIPRFGEALIDVRLVSGLQNILRQINELTKGERTSLSYRIKGRLYYKGGFGFVSFDSSGEITLPTGNRKSST